jgi:serine/threonine protein kinase
MQLLGLSLENILHKLPTKKMTLKTVSMLGIQMIKILKLIHDKHYIHRDIKPDNFTMGINEDNNKLFIIDFGLSKKFRDPKTLKQNPLIKRKKITGTARYASIKALEGYEQSRRDDLESVGYLIVYLLKGFLPWQGLLIKSKNEKYAKILQKKKNISEDELCENLPYQIRDFLIYVKELKYEEEPNYDYLINLFNDIINGLNENFDKVYDWNFNKSCIYQINRFSGRLMTIQQRKHSNSPYNHKRKNTLNYHLISNHCNSNFGTKPNETLSNNGKTSSFNVLYKINNIDFNEEIKSSFIYDDDKEKYDINKYINQNCNRKNSLYLYKTNINTNNNNKCTCCCIM